MIDRAQRTFWDFATRNAIRLGTVIVAARILYRQARGK